MLCTVKGLGVNAVHWAITDFRAVGMDLRLLDKSLDACSLATHLSAYEPVGAYTARYCAT